jgi:hypothetical protein
VLSLDLVVLSAAAILVSGCAEQKKPAIHWGTVVLVRPTLVRQPTADPMQLAEDEPDLQLEIPPAIPPLPSSRTVPPKPRPAVSSSSAPSPSPTKRDPPEIVPELTTQESAALRGETEQSLRAAERNLTAAAGKNMNAVQTDLASKVRSFIAEAREAGQLGDWARARNLAKKAQLLSDELIGSF